MRVIKGVRYYGGRLGDIGLKEDKTRCIEEVGHPIGSGIMQDYEQCKFKRGHGPRKEYCRKHDPATVAMRQAKRDKKYKEKSKQWNIEWEDRRVGQYLREHKPKEYKRLLSKSQR